jgi:hypothetical protein
MAIDPDVPTKLTCELKVAVRMVVTLELDIATPELIVWTAVNVWAVPSFATPLTAVETKAVVAMEVELSPDAAVGALVVPESTALTRTAALMLAPLATVLAPLSVALIRMGL